MTRAFRPTGDDWCTEVPAGWGYAALRRLGTVVGGGTPPAADVDNWNGDTPFVTPPDLRPVVGGAVTSTARTVTAEAAAKSSAVVPANSVLVSIRAPIGYVARTAMDVAFNQGCRALVPKTDVNARYLTYALVAAAPELEAQGRGTTFMEVSATQFAAVKVPVPPANEQCEIADYLDRETSQIDAFIKEQERLIELAKERRSALITAAVTGQVDVREGVA